jgi:ribosomal protein S18 acetylase RimI-like enzyme
MHRLRAAEPEDQPFVSILLPDYQPRELERVLKPAHGCTLVAEVKEPASVIAVGRITGWKNGAELCDVAVDAAFRRRGIGSALVIVLLRWCSRRQCEFVELTCRRDNAAALALYDRLGFQPVRTVMIDSQPHTLMRLDSVVLEHFSRD